MLAISYDGIKWFDARTLNPVSSNDGSPVTWDFGFVPTYLWKYNVFFAVRADDAITNSGIRYVFSYDGINWQSGGTNPILASTGTSGGIHNAGLQTDLNGAVNSSTPNTYYGANINCCGDYGTANIDRTVINFAP